MAVCCICFEEHNRWRDAAHTKPAAYCRACHAAYNRANRTRHRDLPDEARKRANARSYANVYLRRGKIIRRPCQSCGDPDSEMHHEDYNKPTEVDWYCRSCHLELHIIDPGR